MEAYNNQAHQCLLLKDSEALRDRKRVMKSEIASSRSLSLCVDSKGLTDQTGGVRQSLVGDCLFVLRDQTGRVRQFLVGDCLFALGDQTGRVRQSLVGDCLFVLTVKG